MSQRNRPDLDGSHGSSSLPSLSSTLKREYASFGIDPGFFDRAVVNGRFALGMIPDADYEWTEALQSWCHDFVQEHLADAAFLAAQHLLRQQTMPSRSSSPENRTEESDPPAPHAPPLAKPLSVMEERIKAIKRATLSPTINEVFEAVRENSKRDLMMKEASQTSLLSLPRKPAQCESDAVHSPGRGVRSKRDLVKKEKSQRSLKDAKHKKSKRDLLKKEESRQSVKEGKRRSKRDLLKKEGKSHKSERNLTKKEKSKRCQIEGKRGKSERDLMKKEKSKRSLMERQRGKSERDLLKKEKAKRSLMEGQRKKSKDNLLAKDGSQRSLVEAKRKKSKRDLMKKEKSQMSLVDGKRKKSRRSDLMKKDESQRSLVQTKRKKSKRDLMKKEESLRLLNSKFLRKEVEPECPPATYATGSLHATRRDLMKKDPSHRSLSTTSQKSVGTGSSDSVPRTPIVANATVLRTSRRNLMMKCESQSSLHSLPKQPVRSRSGRSDDMEPALQGHLDATRPKSMRDLMKKEESLRSLSSLHSLPKMPVRRGSKQEAAPVCESPPARDSHSGEALVEMPPLEPMLERIVVVRRSSSDDAVPSNQVETDLPVPHSRGIPEQPSESETGAAEAVCITSMKDTVDGSLMIKEKSVESRTRSCGRVSPIRVRPVAILTTIEDNDSSTSSISFESNPRPRDPPMEDMNPERWGPLSRSRLGMTRPGTPSIGLTGSSHLPGMP